MRGTALGQNLVRNVRKAHGVRSPGVDVHRSLSTDALHQDLLSCGHIVVVDGDQLDRDMDGARVVVRRTRGIGDVHHLAAVGRDMGEPVFEVVADDHLGLGIVRASAISRQTPDGFFAGAIGIDVDPFAVGRIVGAVVVVDVRGESLLHSPGSGQAVDVKLTATVALGHEGERLVVRRPAVEVAGRIGGHQSDVAAIGIGEKDLGILVGGYGG